MTGSRHAQRREWEGTSTRSWDSDEKPISNDIALQVPALRKGVLYPNDGPGYGIDLNEDFIAANITAGKEAHSVQ